MKREKLAARRRRRAVERAQQFLRDGEQVRGVFFAQTGPHPKWLFLGGAVLVLASVRQVTVLVTDDGLVVVNCSIWNGRPTSLRLRISTGTTIDVPAFGKKGKNEWDRVVMDGPYWVHRRNLEHLRIAARHLELTPGSEACPT